LTIVGQQATPLPKALKKQDLTDNAPVTYHTFLALCKPTPPEAVKSRPTSSTHKKVVVVFADRTSLPGYVNPSRLQPSQPLDLLTTEGEHRSIAMKDLRAIYFVRDFTGKYEPERKAFFSRPKLDGLWVRLTFLDRETLEGVVPNDLLSLLDSGVQITPPDLNGEAVRIYVPRSALAELTVLGVVGVARRKAAPAVPAQPKLFSE
jgi:Family of unknown function (DUF6982)